MKVALISDTHQEFSGPSYLSLLPDDGYVDVIVAAGDIDSGSQGLRDLMDLYKKTQIIYVPGNHEYYGSSLKDVNEELIDVSENKSNVHLFIDGGMCIIDDVKFVGGVGWSAPEDPQVKRMINDYRVIRDSGLINTELREFFVDYLALMADNTERKMVGIMHFLPHNRCVSERWSGPAHAFLNNNYFVTGIEEDVLEKFDFFLFGHTHDSADFEMNGTRFLCNPKGYPMEYNYNWEPLIFDV